MSKRNNLLPASVKALQREARASEPETLLAFQMRASGIAFEREVKAIEGRKFRFDFRINPPDGRLLVEVDGGLFAKGNSGHTSAIGATRDREKGAMATALGYYVMRVAPAHVKSGQALAWIQQFLSEDHSP